MSSQVVSIPSSVFYAPPQLESDSGLQAGGIGQFCAPLPGRFHASCRLRPALHLYPLTFSCLSAYFLLGKIAFILPASFPPRTWIGFLWLLFCPNTFFSLRLRTLLQ